MADYIDREAAMAAILSEPPSVEQFYTGCNCRSCLKVLSGRTGRVLTPQYKQEKHAETVGKMKILSVWAELQVTNSGFGNYCRPIMCCYVSDRGDENEM